MSPVGGATDVFGEMCQDPNAPEPADEVDNPDVAGHAARQRLRTFRTSSDRPYLVLPEAQHDRRHDQPTQEPEAPTS